MSVKADVIVLGAGMVGLGAALALQARGRDVVLIDKTGEAGRGTSYGPAGLIERSSIQPYIFPRNFSKIAQVIFGQAPEARIDWARAPKFLPWVAQYFWLSAPARAARNARAALPLIERCLDIHIELAKQAGADNLLRRGGWIKAFRTEASFGRGAQDARAILPHGLTFEILDQAALARLEPDVTGFFGAVRYIDPISVVDPGGLALAYSKLFEKRGGKLMAGEARSLEQVARGWRVATQYGPCEAPQAVLALGPWSDDIYRPLGYAIPLGVKRGYHMHYAPRAGARVGHPILDADGGYFIAPMLRGLRLTTGAEFSTRTAPPNPKQLDWVEPSARKNFPLAERLDAQPWMGARPCLPDLLPVIGPAPRHAGLWFDFGHQHHGLTLGPISGELLAQMMTGEAPFADPAPYRVDRF